MSDTQSDDDVAVKDDIYVGRQKPRERRDWSWSDKSHKRPSGRRERFCRPPPQYDDPSGGEPSAGDGSGRQGGRNGGPNRPYHDSSAYDNAPPLEEDLPMHPLCWFCKGVKMLMMDMKRVKLMKNQMFVNKNMPMTEQEISITDR